MRKRLALILLSCVLCVAATALQPALIVGNATEVTGQTITGSLVWQIKIWKGPWAGIR